MELITVNPPQQRMTRIIEHHTQQRSFRTPKETSTSKPFIEANTMDISFEDICEQHIIPVYIKDNEPLISHADFIETTVDVAKDIFSMETILSPTIRMSHPIKGRIPEARNKPAIELSEHEKTIYYERMAFVVEVPTIYDDINGNRLNLTLGGVKSYNLDNINTRKGSNEHFKLFIGFQNKVCTNMCVYSDGYLNEVKVSSIGHLKACIRTLFETYNYSLHLNSMSKLPGYALSEHQFATLMGRCKMYQYLPKENQGKIKPLMFGENQLSAVCRDYYRDDSFCRDEAGSINLWNLYNLFTGSNKSSYIDNFFDKSVNAFDLVYDIKDALDNKTTNWYLN
ncbi:MAG TPA: DUF3871 family protein [Segetibacter sp.]|jgi:hypothetical protein